MGIPLLTKDFMKIDIYIPTYNRKELLKRAIESALMQTYVDITIIVSDNASEDGTENMMWEVFGQNPKIQYFRQKSNIGALANFQKCIYEYGGWDYCLFLSDDDELLDNTYIEKAVNHITKNNRLVIITANTKINYSDIDISFDTSLTLPECIPWKEFLLHYGTWSYSISWCNALFNRKIAIQSDCYNGQVFYADSDCFFRLMVFGDVWFIDTVASLYRVHAQNSYKIAPLEVFIKNENYILRNYDFVWEKGNCTPDELFSWKDRLLSWYRSTMLDNLLLFSKNPLSNARKALKILKNRWYRLTFPQYLRLTMLYVVRFFTRFKPVLRFLISRNYK